MKDNGVVAGSLNCEYRQDDYAFMKNLSRRSVLKAAAGAVVLGPAGWRHAVCAEDGTGALPTPTPAQSRWQNCEIGVIYHLDMPLVAGDFTANNGTRKTYDPRLYNPVRLDTDQWIAAAKAVGAKYAIFTATHFNGFMQWQSDLYPYSLKYVVWRNGKGDIVADFVTSCRKADILPGIYLSTHRNAYQTVWGHYVDWGKGRGTEQQKAYNRIAEKQTEELCSRYGKLVQIWYDAGVKTPEQGGPDVLPIFEKYQPDSVFYHSEERSDHRWIGNEEGHAGYPCWATMPGHDRGAVSHNSDVWKGHLYHGDADGSLWSPGMVDIVLRGKGNHDWFWRPGKDNTQYPVETLMQIYDASVGRNCNLVIGLVVDNQGLVPQPDVDRMAEFGRALKHRFSEPAGRAQGQGESMELKLDRPQKINQMVLQEEISAGERIQAYELHGRTAGDHWIRLAAGTAVGHKRIECFDSVEVDAIRLQVTRSRAMPLIRTLAAGLRT
ncbi:MAG: alpha-L-fucosidase [Sedimentisphaerales bacterium]